MHDNNNNNKTLTNALLIVCFGIADVLKFELAQTLSKLLLSQGELWKADKVESASLKTGRNVNNNNGQCVPGQGVRIKGG